MFTQKHGAGKRRTMRVSALCKPCHLHGNFQYRICSDICRILDLHTPNATFNICQDV